jgi:MFS family permease
MQANPDGVTAAATAGPVRTHRSLVPARLDRLPWARFHWRVVVALGITWILDGLEIQIVAQIGTVLQQQGTLHLSNADVAWVAPVYLLGEVVGALVFGRITDHFGRKKLFVITLLLYLFANGIAGVSFSLWFLLIFRFLAGMGIGGEYTAINSAIDELIPPRYRGRADIAINGTYWWGAMIGAFANVFLLNPHWLPVNLGWRIGFFIGPVLALWVIFLRRALPESPRWLMSHGQHDKAERIVEEIEDEIRKTGAKLQPVPQSHALEIRGRSNVSYRQIWQTMRRDHPKRSFLGFSVMATQMVLYNSIFFTYTTVLGNVYHIEYYRTSYYIIVFAAANLAGPLTLGKLFDTVGRRKMITLTYCVSGSLLVASAHLFSPEVLTATTQNVILCVIFFFASTGASSAYLTVSEIFPLEVRSQAISFFFAISTLIGGVATPPIFEHLIGDGTNVGPLIAGYYAVGAIMFAGGVIAWWFAVDAERKSLEEIANPLSAVRRVIEPPIERT